MKRRLKAPAKRPDMQDLMRRLESVEKTMVSMGALVEHHDRQMTRINELTKRVNEALSGAQGVIESLNDVLDDIKSLKAWRASMQAEREERETYNRLKQKYG